MAEPKKMSLKDKLTFERELQKDGLARQSRIHLHNVVAEHTLHQDLGWEEGELSAYDLDQTTRDRLLAHARQDASLSVIVASAIEKQTHQIKRLLWIIILMLGGVMYLLGQS